MNTGAFAAALAVAVSVGVGLSSFSPVQAYAQTNAAVVRGLPDFTDLVD